MPDENGNITIADVVAVYGCEPTCEDATKVRWIFRYVAQLPDPMRRKVIAKLSADYIDGPLLIDGADVGLCPDEPADDGRTGTELEVRDAD